MTPGTTARVCLVGCACGVALALAVHFHRADRHGDNPAPLFIGLAVGLVLSGVGFRYLRKRRLVQNIPTSKIRSMAMGLVEVKGKAMGPAAFEAPFSGEPCVYYDVRVEEYRKGKDSSRWVQVFTRNTNDLPFNVSDETGHTSVRPEGAEILLSETFSFRNQGRGVPSKVEWYLMEKGFSIHGFVGLEKNLRFSERVIRPGQELYVIGECRTEKDRLRGDTRTRELNALRAAKADPERMRTFDKDGDGKVSGEEWDEARTKITREAMGAPDIEGTCVMKPTSSGGAFVITDKQETNLARRYGWAAFGCVFGGIGLFGVCLFFLLRALG